MLHDKVRSLLLSNSCCVDFVRMYDDPVQRWQTTRWHDMNRSIAIALLGISLPAGIAHATNPPPSPTQTNVQGQAQGQGQFQGQQQRATGGQGGGGGAGGTGQGGSGGTGGSQSQGQNTTVNNNNGNGGGWNGGPGQWPASSAYAPSFALGSMCQESTSGGISVFWAGVSGGGVRTMEFCVVKMKADHFRALGNESMAKAMECANSELRAAYKATGAPCPADVAQPAQAAPVSQQRVLNAGGLQCVDAAGRPVALGQPGAVRCQ